MILNIYTIIMLFIAIITGLLAVPLGLFAFKIYKKCGSSLYDEEKTVIENRSYLLMLMATVILFVKLLTWPFLYVSLQSYIPNIQGAMCIFGVTQAQPLMSGLVQIIKPVVFFLIGAWLLLNRLDRKTETSPLFRKKFLFLSVVSIFVLSDSIVDFLYLTGFDIKVFVSCCTTFFDLPDRGVAGMAVSLLGEGYGRYLLPLYYISGLAFAASQIVLFRRLAAGSGLNAILTAGVVLSVINAVVTVLTMFEVIAPKVMNLPLHHCIYCMWQYEPHSIIMTALFIIGTFAPGWALILYNSGMHEETMHFLKKMLRKLSLAAMACILASMAIATLYMIL